MIGTLFKVGILYILLSIGIDIVAPSKSFVKGMVVESNSFICAIQPIEGPLVVTEAYYYCPVGHMVTAYILYKENATEFETGKRIESINVLIGL